MLQVDQITKSFENGDFARNNLFEVEIPFLGRDFKFKCRAAQLPPASLEHIDVSYQNRKMKIGGDRTFEDWTITVYNDEEHNVRQQFVDWQRQVNEIDRRIYGETPETYKKPALVRQYNRRSEETRVVNIFGSWPKNVGEVQLDWDSNNEIQTFEVTLAIDWWE